MNEPKKPEFVKWIERFCGQKVEPADYADVARVEFPKKGLGRSQLNELLLSFGLDRVDEAFFRYVFEKKDIPDIDKFIEKVKKYRVKAVIKYGNFKFSFKHLKNKNMDFICNEFGDLEPRNIDFYRQRHAPLIKLKRIKPENTYYLGYLINRELKEKKGAGQIVAR